MVQFEKNLSEYAEMTPFDKALEGFIKIHGDKCLGGETHDIRLKENIPSKKEIYLYCNECNRIYLQLD